MSQGKRCKYKLYKFKYIGITAETKDKWQFHWSPHEIESTYRVMGWFRMEGTFKGHLEEDQVWEYLSKLDIHMSIDPWMLNELADVIHCEATLDNFWSSMPNGRSIQRLQERQISLLFKKSKTEDLRSYRLGQPYLSPWEADGTVNPGNHFRAHEVQENHQ